MHKLLPRSKGNVSDDLQKKEYNCSSPPQISFSLCFLTSQRTQSCMGSPPLKLEIQYHDLSTSIYFMKKIYIK